MRNRKKPPALGADGFRNVFSLAANNSEDRPESLAAQRLSARFGLTPAMAALIAELAGLGGREVRA
jgi:hypothetical protein